MPATLDNVSTSNAYPAAGGGGAQLLQTWNAKGGYIAVNGNDAYAQVQYSLDAGSGQGQPEWTEEIHIPVGTMTLPAGATGIRFRSYVAGSPAVVTAVIFAGPEPLLQIGAGGQLQNITVTGITLTETVGVNPPLTNRITWADATNTSREFIAGLYDGLANHHELIFDAGGVDLIWKDDGSLFGANSFGVGLPSATLPKGGTGTWMDNTGLFLSVAAVGATVLQFAASGDTDPRFTVSSWGTMGWGPGGVASTDTYLYRANTSQLKTDGQMYAQGGWGANVIAANNLFRNWLLAGDAQPAFAILGNGTLQWGPGGASATDTSLARTAAGTMTFTLSALNVTTAAANSGVAINTSGAGNALRIFTSGDANPRLAADFAGALSWGPGGASATDITWARTAAGLWRMTTGTGFGYGTGTGGAVTQLTSFNTGVTLSKPTGVITLFTSATIAGTVSTFVVTNTVVAAQDVVVLSWGTGTNPGALLSVANVAAGSFTITWEAVTANASSTRTINFAVIKGANA